ncbi:MAG: hypothetical protein Q4B54_05220, partial [Coriobacteriales bacterium]|nr:hypothetical protein [Coriobacteriales bacterium]
NAEVFSDPAGSGYKVFAAHLTTGGPQIWSRVYSVRDGSPVEISVSGYVTVHNGQFMVARAQLTPSGRRTRWYSMSFDPSSFAFIEGSFVGETQLYMLP